MLWLEQRPNEGGRTTTLIRPWDASQFPAQELTPAPMNLRSRVHTYGGAALASLFDRDKLLLVWIDASDRFLWSQSWQPLFRPNRENGIWFNSLDSPRCLSCHSEYAIADGLIDVLRKRWIGVMERDGRDFLVSFSLDHEFQNPTIIHRPKDFAGYAALSPDGTQLAWVE